MTAKPVLCPWGVHALIQQGDAGSPLREYKRYPIYLLDGRFPNSFYHDLESQHDPANTHQVNPTSFTNLSWPCSPFNMDRLSSFLLFKAGQAPLDGCHGLPLLGLYLLYIQRWEWHITCGQGGREVPPNRGAQNARMAREAWYLYSPSFTCDRPSQPPQTPTENQLCAKQGTRYWKSSSQQNPCLVELTTEWEASTQINMTWCSLGGAGGDAMNSYYEKISRVNKLTGITLSIMVARDGLREGIHLSRDLK